MWGVELFSIRNQEIFLVYEMREYFYKIVYFCWLLGIKCATRYVSIFLLLFSSNFIDAFPKGDELFWMLNVRFQLIVRSLNINTWGLGKPQQKKEKSGPATNEEKQ